MSIKCTFLSVQQMDFYEWSTPVEPDLYLEMCHSLRNAHQCGLSDRSQVNVEHSKFVFILDHKGTAQLM